MTWQVSETIDSLFADEILVPYACYAKESCISAFAKNYWVCSENIKITAIFTSQGVRTR